MTLKEKGGSAQDDDPATLLESAPELCCIEELPDVDDWLVVGGRCLRFLTGLLVGGKAFLFPGAPGNGMGHAMFSCCQ